MDTLSRLINLITSKMPKATAMQPPRVYLVDANTPQTFQVATRTFLFLRNGMFMSEGPDYTLSGNAGAYTLTPTTPIVFDASGESGDCVLTIVEWK